MAEEHSSEEDYIYEVKNDLQGAIVDAFSLFTPHDSKNIISVTDIGKVIRHLGCVPSEEELKEFIKHVEDKNNPESVMLNIFVSHMEKQIMEFRYQAGTADQLLEAFQTLDTEKIGSLSVQFMQQALREGESFSEEEITEAIRSTYDYDSNSIIYDTWIHQLQGKTKLDVYALISVDDSVQRAADEEANELARLLV